VPVQTTSPRPLRFLDPVMQRIEGSLDHISGELKSACSHLFQAGGKGVRPALVILCAHATRHCAGAETAREDAACCGEAGWEPDPAVVDVAAAAELIHVASLIHDDIIDGAATRRDRSSVNARWGNHTAVLAGDCLFAAAFGLLAPYASLGLVTLMTDAISRMCQGEILQRQQAFDPDVTERAYVERIEGKTASLIAACCEAGARLGGADPAGVRAFREFGLNLGLAYQVIDDVLDFAGDAAAMGKPALADLREGNLTLPVIYLIQRSEWRARLVPCLLRREIDDNTIDSVRRAVKETGALDAALAYGRSLARSAEAALSLLGPAPAADRLLGLLKAAVFRSA